MEITLNTKRIDYQTAVEILNSTPNNSGTYTICGPNLISKGGTIYTYAGIKINEKLYSEYEITPENYNDFYNNVEKTDGNNIKFYLIPPIEQKEDKYTLTANNSIKDSITLCKCTTNEEGITINNNTLTATMNNPTPSAGDIYYNIKTYSHTDTNPENKDKEINIQSQHKIYDNITPAYSNLQTNFTQLESDCRKLYNDYTNLSTKCTTLYKNYKNLWDHYVSEFITPGHDDEDALVYINESINCWVKKSDTSEDSLNKTYIKSDYVRENYTTNCVIDYHYFINYINNKEEDRSDSEKLYCLAPNIICDPKNNKIYSYLGYLSEGIIYNYDCVSIKNLENFHNNSTFLIIEPIKPDYECNANTWLYFCPIQICCYSTDGKYQNWTYNIECTCKMNLDSKINIKMPQNTIFNYNNIKYCELCHTYAHCSNGHFPICIKDYYTPTDKNPWDLYYTIPTANGLVESPHSLIWREEDTDEDNITTYSIGCKSYY